MSDRIIDLLEEGRLIRHAWTGTDAEGRETACLLAAISPEVAQAKAVAACPADIMPPWLAHLTVWMDDAGSESAWPGMVRRYADLASRWHVLDDDAWARLELRAKRIALVEAMRHGGDPVCSRVLELIDRALAGDRPTAAEWGAARASGTAARASAGARASAAVWAAVWAARAAARAPVWAAAEAARASAAAARASAAAWSAVCATTTTARASAAARASRAAPEAAADRMTDAILDAIEAEIAAVEAS